MRLARLRLEYATVGIVEPGAGFLVTAMSQSPPPTPRSGGVWKMKLPASGGSVHSSQPIGVEPGAAT